MELCIGDVLILVSIMSKSCKSLSIQINLERPIGSAKNIESKIKFLMAD